MPAKRPNDVAMLAMNDAEANGEASNLSQQDLLLVCIGNTALRRQEIALAYAMAILAFERGAATNFKTVDSAIMKRWSLAGLLFVKRLAWKKVRETLKAEANGEANDAE